MDLTLKITLINRLILAQDANAVFNNYYTIDSWGEQGQVTAYTWINVDFPEPDQAALDAENLIYQEEVLEREIKPLVNELAKRVDPTLEYWAFWNFGSYSDVKWQDELQNEANAAERTKLQNKIDQDLVTKTTLEADLVDLQAEKTTLEANENPTVAQIERLEDLTNNIIPRTEISIGRLEQQILEDTIKKDSIVDVVVSTKPTWQQIKDEYVVYKSEQAAAKAAEDAEEAELQAMDIGAILMSLIGPDVRYFYEKRLLYKNLVVKGGNKPTLQEMRDEWAILQPILIAEKTRAAKKGGGSIVRQICTNILDLVAGNNLEKNLTIEQIDQMETDYADVLVALKNFRPDKAKALILALTPDGTFVTQEDKDEYLAEFAKFGL